MIKELFVKGHVAENLNYKVIEILFIKLQRPSGQKFEIRVIKELFVKDHVAENLKQSDKEQVAKNLKYRVVEALFVNSQVAEKFNYRVINKLYSFIFHRE